MSDAGRTRTTFMVLMGLPLALACGEAPQNDFHSPNADGTGSIGGSGPVATATSGTSTNATTSSGGSSTSAVSTSAGGSTSGVTTTGGGSSTGGTSPASCESLPTWEGGNPEFTLDTGDEMQHNGHRYRANQDITYPNPECAPDAPVEWCAGWFEDLGPC